MVTAAQARGLIEDVARAVAERQAQLDRLDAVAGDGDHGATMVMGLRAVTSALPGGEMPVAELLRIAANRFASVGGSTGPLWGTALLRAAQRLDSVAGPGLPEIAAAAEAAAQGIADRGRCREGDKTLLDVMAPAARALSAAAAEGADAPTAVRRACEAARAGLEATRELDPQHGRARLAAGRSRGHEDAGAASALIVWETAAARVG